MKALIFAAGLGTRLKPITDTLPKALVPVSGHPLLWHVVEKLKGAGITDFVINVHHFADKIRDYVAANNSFGVNIAFSDETDLLRETGGGIRHAAPLLATAPAVPVVPAVPAVPVVPVSDADQHSVSVADEPFLVHNVDILSNLDIEQFIAKHLEPSGSAPAHHALATLLVSDRKTQRYLLFNEEDLMIGWMNIQTGQVKSPYPHLRREPDAAATAATATATAAAAPSVASAFDWQAFLQEHNLKKYAFDGAHVISPEIFGLMEEMPEKFSIIDFYIGICHKHNIRYHIQPNLEMIDVGKLDSLQKAEEFLSVQ